MIFFFNANGDLLKGNPDTVYQGSSNAGKIYAVAPLNPGLIADIYFTLPNGDEAGPYLLTNGGTVIEGKELPDGYALWFINLNSNLTQFAGDLTAQIGFYATEDMTAETADGVAQKVPVITTQAFNIVISRGVARTLPAEPTNDIYEQIVNKLTLLTNISNVYPPASIKDIGEAAVTYDTTNVVTSKTTEQWTGTNGETFDIETERKLPIKGGKNIAIGVTEDGKFIEVKSTADPIEQDEKGKPGGVPTLDSNGQIPSSQLPTYVDDVIDGYVVGSTPFAADWLSKTPNGAPLTPEKDKIYIVVSEGEYINIEYRWSGTVYAELGKTTPLSDTTGQGTNIGMTQKAITDELAKKQDKLAIYTVNTAAEVTIPADDLAKIKADPNAIIVEIDSTKPSVETRFYKKGIDFIGGTVFVSIYTVVGAEVAEGCSIAYRELNPTTGVLTARHETNATSLAEVRQEIEGKYLPKPSGNPTEDSLVKVSSVGTSSWIAISDIKVPIIEIPSASTTITQEQANIIINNKDVTILYGTTQKIIYRKFTEYELTTTHLAYFVQFGGANPDAAQKIKQLVLTVDLNNLTVSRVELEIPRISFITGTDEDENDVVLQTKFAKEVFDTPAVKANPTLKGTEEELTALQVGLTKYKVPSGGSFEGKYDRSIQIGKTAKAGGYSVAIGELSDSVVTVNPTGAQALAIGYKCSEKHGMGVVIGYDSQSGAQNQTIIGYAVKGTNAPGGAIIIGTYPSGIDSSDKVVLGYGSTKYFNVRFVNGSFVASVAGKQLAFLEEVKPADNPTEDSVVKVSSTGTVSYLPVSSLGGGGGGSSFKVQTFTINADDITATGSGETIAYTLTESCLAPLKEGCLNAGKNGYLFATTEYNAVVGESALFGKLYTLISGFYTGDTASMLTLQMVDSSGVSGKEINLISGRFSVDFKNDVETIKNAGGTIIIKIVSI